MTEFTAWITKYALTEGIYELRVIPASADGGMVEAVGATYATYYHVEGRDWHRTRVAAVARAETLRKAKIASLRKSITKLEKMEFGG